MSSESDNPNTESDSPNTGVLVTIVAVGALAMVGISLAVTALVRYEVDVNEGQKGATANPRPYREARAEWEKKLNAPPSWVKPGQQVSLPIDRAMQLVVADIQKNPSLATRVKPASDAGTTAPEAGAEAQADGAAAEPQPAAAPAPEGTAAPTSPAPPAEGKTQPSGAMPAPQQPAPAAPAPKPNPQGNAP